MTAGYVKSSHVVRPTAPDIGRCQHARLHPAGNKPFISPEHHNGASNLMSRCPVSRIMINIDVISGPIIHQSSAPDSRSVFSALARWSLSSSADRLRLSRLEAVAFAHVAYS